jgi:hypothetical protein
MNEKALLAANPAALRNFTQLITAAEDGRLLSDLTEAVQEASLAMRDSIQNGGKGTAELTLKVKLRLDRGLVEMEGDFNLKVPKHRRARTLLHMMPNGELSLNDYRQPDLPLRDANAATQVRTA